MTLSANKSITLLALLLVFALAAVVRIECACDELWIDEYITGWTVAESFDEAAIRARQSNQSLPYTWMMFGVTRLSGLSPASIRAPSVICGLAIVALCSWFAWRLSRHRSAAVLAGFLAAIDPNFVFYSSEARPYALVQLLGLIGVWSLSEWLAAPTASKIVRKPLPPIIWIVATVSMFYLHFTSLFAVVAQLIVGSLACIVNKTVRPGWIIASLMVVLVCLPGLAGVATLYERSDDWQGFSSITSFAQIGRAHV